MAEFALTHLSVATTADAAVRLRSSAGWGEWLPLASCTRGRSLVVTRDATGYEVQTADGSPATVTELNTVDGPAGAAAAPAADRLPVVPGAKAYDRRVPRYLSRAAWGADESLRFDAAGAEKWPVAYYPVQTLTVHHTGIYEHNEDPDPAATVRAVYYDDTINDNYGDVGYQLLIDRDGRVYEGRVSGADPFPVYGPLGPDRRPQMANGAHVGGYNAGNIGVVLLGRFTSAQPAPAARDSLVKVLAALSVVSGLDPDARTTYRNPVTGVGGEVDVIGGHRDWAAVGAGATECPGDAFHPTLASVRRDVADLIS